MSSIAPAAGESPPRPVIEATVPLPARLRAMARLWLLKTIVFLYITWKTYFPGLPHSQRPTYTKNYAALPEIECRVFIPSSYKAGDKPLPLYIDIHGGGFCVGHPLLDDRENAIISQKHGFVVVAISYRLAPQHKFPELSLDVATLIQAVIKDQELPIDRSNVVVAGYSAGGNLSLSATQLYDLHKVVKAVVAYYPVVDFTTSSAEKLLTRVDDGKKDMLDGIGAQFNSAYIPEGVDRRDPVLSPLFASRDKLPKHIYLIGCEHDLLRNEAKVMAENLAMHEAGEKKTLVEGVSWQKGSIRWELIKGEIHGFNQIPGNKEETARRRARAEKMYADVTKWLKDDIFGQK